MGRIWNETVARISPSSLAEFEDACRMHFSQGKPCLGCLEYPGGEEKEYMLSHTPVPRKIAKSCEKFLGRGASEDSTSCSECLRLEDSKARVIIEPDLPGLKMEEFNDGSDVLYEPPLDEDEQMEFEGDSVADAFVEDVAVKVEQGGGDSDGNDPNYDDEDMSDDDNKDFEDTESYKPSPRRKCQFQSHWIDNDDARDESGDKLLRFFVPDEGDKYLAFCTVCAKSISISNNGKASLVQHAKGSIHREKVVQMKALPEEEQVQLRENNIKNKSKGESDVIISESPQKSDDGRRLTKYRQDWLRMEDDDGHKFGDYIVPDEDSEYRVFCRVCSKSLSIANAGKASLLQHARGVVHKEKVKMMKSLPEEEQAKFISMVSKITNEKRSAEDNMSTATAAHERYELGDPRRYTRYKERWLNLRDELGYKFGDYTARDEEDDRRAFCTVCSKSFSIANGGKSSLLQHARGGIHKKKVGIKLGPPKPVQIKEEKSEDDIQPRVKGECGDRMAQSRICPWCPRVFRSLNLFDMHKRRVHFWGEFKCSQGRTQ